MASSGRLGHIYLREWSQVATSPALTLVVAAQIRAATNLKYWSVEKGAIFGEQELKRCLNIMLTQETQDEQYKLLLYFCLYFHLLCARKQ